MTEYNATMTRYKITIIDIDHLKNTVIENMLLNKFLVLSEIVLLTETTQSAAK